MTAQDDQAQRERLIDRALPDAADIGSYSYCSAQHLEEHVAISLREAVAVFEGDELRALVFGPTAKLDANLFITLRASGGA
jgi:hypothetical protein